MIDVLLFDLSNMAYYCAHRLYRGFERRPDAASMILEATEEHMRSVYRQFSPKKLIFACDYHSYWRTDIFPTYKGQREITPVKLLVRKAIEGFKEKNRQHCIEVEKAEADDVIFVATEMLEGSKVIVSSDRDFMQLVSSEVKLFNPLESRFRRSQNCSEFDLFLKCIRGDVSDNIPSAYPRITEKKLKKAFSDPELYEEIMNAKLKDDTIVKDNFARNKQLIDLTQVPVDLRAAIAEKFKVHAMSC